MKFIDSIAVRLINYKINPCSYVDVMEYAINFFDKLVTSINSRGNANKGNIILIVVLCNNLTPYGRTTCLE